MAGKQDAAASYTVDRIFIGSRTAAEVVADIIRAHGE